MSLSQSSNTYNRVAWEDAEFPILCQVCLGDNPYMRMMKEKYGGECKICSRPFTTFRWCPGRGMRYKKTEICQTCSKIKNVCQTCLLDLEYGLPVQVRDYALQIKDELPKMGANKDFYIQNQEKALAETDGTRPGGSLGQLSSTQSDVLHKLARTSPYYRRNLPHICSFWVKGECKRGEECPYRHEKPTDPDDPLSDQNIRDRYYGVNDPVADKLLTRSKGLPQLRVPDDRTVTTLYVGNLGDDGVITEKELSNYFYQFGEIRSITVLGGKGCAFVQFTSRDSAELAAESSFNKLTISGRKLTIRWGRPQSFQSYAQGALEGAGRPLEAVPGLPKALPPPDFFNLNASDFEPATLVTEDIGVPAKKKMRSSEMISIPTISGNVDIPLPPALPAFLAKPVSQMPSADNSNVASLTPGNLLPRLPPPPGVPPLRPPPRVPSNFPERQPIYYPSQDPQRLGAKDLND